jgi:AraC family transcriptional regulator
VRVPSYSSFSQLCHEGRRSSYVRALRSSGGLLCLVESAMPAGTVSDPGVPDLVLHQALVSGCRATTNLGAGKFSVTTERGSFFLAPPNFALSASVDRDRRARSLSFPAAQWKELLVDSSDSSPSFDFGKLHRGPFGSATLRTALQQLWSLCDEAHVPSRLLAQAAGCEILAELYRLSGRRLAAARGGLAPWAERRCLELMRARLSEDISLDELAAEAQLSPFHFARMFKQSVGVPPRIYLTRLRVEKACELLEQTDLSVTEIAFEVGYSSNQVLARVFLKHMRLSPSDYRRAARGSMHSIALQ